MQTIERVDELVRKNNAKYKDEQSQKAYEQALKDYERQAKAQQARQYAQIVKEGNRRAVEKAKQTKRQQKAKSKAKRAKQQNVQPPPEEPVQRKEEGKKKMSQEEARVVRQTIQARAERIMQEQQLQRLNRKLQEQKKRTKLYELNQKCKKMLSKSHERIVSAKNVPEERMKILRQLEDKAVGEINELDCIINNLIDKANQNRKESALPSRAHANHHHSSKALMSNQPAQHEQRSQQASEEQKGPNEEDFDVDLQQEWELQLPDEEEDNFLSINRAIFEKTSEELLQMEYIPL